MNPVKRTMTSCLSFFGLFLLGIICNVLSESRIFFLYGLSSVYYLALGVVIVIYFRTRIIDEPMRRYLIIIGFMIAFWGVL